MAKQPITTFPPGYGTKVAAGNLGVPGVRTGKRALTHLTEAAAPNNLRRQQGSNQGGGGGGGSGPVSTLAGLPQTPLLKDLIAKGIIKEGMPQEQALAILAISQTASQNPVDLAALKKMIMEDYGNTTGDIFGPATDWMQQLYGANTPLAADDPNAALFAQDPIWGEYAGGLQQMQETANTNQATDLAWLDKQQQAMTDYYNGLVASVASGQLPVGGSGGGGGGGGGGRRGGYGGGDGGNGSDGDPFTEPDTKVVTKNAADVDMSHDIVGYNPGWYQAVLDQFGNNAFITDAVRQHSRPDDFTGYLSGEATRILAEIDAADTKNAENAQWTENAPNQFPIDLQTYLGARGLLLGDDPTTEDETEFYYEAAPGQGNPVISEDTARNVEEFNPIFQQYFTPEQFGLNQGNQNAALSGGADLLNQMLQLRQEIETQNAVPQEQFGSLEDKLRGQGGNNNGGGGGGNNDPNAGNYPTSTYVPSIITGSGGVYQGSIPGDPNNPTVIGPGGIPMNPPTVTPTGIEIGTQTTGPGPDIGPTFGQRDWWQGGWRIPQSVKDAISGSAIPPTSIYQQMQGGFGNPSPYPPGEQWRAQLNQSTPQPNAQQHVQDLLAPLYEQIRNPVTYPGGNPERPEDAGNDELIAQILAGNTIPGLPGAGDSVKEQIFSQPSVTMPPLNTDDLANIFGNDPTQAQQIMPNGVINGLAGAGKSGFAGANKRMPMGDPALPPSNPGASVLAASTPVDQKAPLPPGMPTIGPRNRQPNLKDIYSDPDIIEAYAALGPEAQAFLRSTGTMGSILQQPAPEENITPSDIVNLYQGQIYTTDASGRQVLKPGVLEAFQNYSNARGQDWQRGYNQTTGPNPTLPGQFYDKLNIMSDADRATNQSLFDAIQQAIALTDPMNPQLNMTAVKDQMRIGSNQSTTATSTTNAYDNPDVAEEFTGMKWPGVLTPDQSYLMEQDQVGTEPILSPEQSLGFRMPTLNTKDPYTIDSIPKLLDVPPKMDKYIQQAAQNMTRKKTGVPAVKAKAYKPMGTKSYGKSPMTKAQAYYQPSNKKAYRKF